MLVAGNRTDRQVMLFSERAGEDISTSGTQCGSGSYIPPVVLLGIRAAPSYIGGYGISRYTPFPTITALYKGCSGEGDGGVHGRERMVIAAVG